MPILLSEEVVKMDWADIQQSEQEAARIGLQASQPSPRSKGIHLSGVLRYIAISTGALKGKVGGVVSTSGEVDEESMPIRMALGMAWERWVAGLYPEMEWQPGEVELDGIVGSPDGFTYDASIAGDVARRMGVDSPLVVEEFKCTWKSSFHPFLSKKNDLWMWQGMGYAHMMGTRWVRWHAMYVNGDYRVGGCGEPTYKKYLVEFSQNELEGNWRRVMMNKNEPGVIAE